MSSKKASSPRPGPGTGDKRCILPENREKSGLGFHHRLRKQAPTGINETRRSAFSCGSAARSVRLKSALQANTESVGASLLAKRPVHPEHFGVFTIAFASKLAPTGINEARRSAFSCGNAARSVRLQSALQAHTESVGASLLAKRPVHPEHFGVFTIAFASKLAPTGINEARRTAFSCGNAARPVPLKSALQANTASVGASLLAKRPVHPEHFRSQRPASTLR